MADITFPSYNRVLSWAEAPNQNSVLRTPMEDGTPKQARRFARNYAIYTMSILMSDAEYTAFKSWFLTDAEHGAKDFNFADPQTGVVKDFRLRGGQFNARPINQRQTYWNVSVEMEAYL